jgi:hypothetical protein
MLKPLIEEDKYIFEDIDELSDKEDKEFNMLIKEELRAKDNFINLDNLNNIEFINSGQSKLLLDLLIGDVINIFSEVSFTLRTYKEVLDLIKKQVNNKHIFFLPCLRFKYLLI